MSVKTTIEADIKAALISGDKERANILRVLKSSLLQAEVDGGKRDQGLSDTESLKILSKEFKRRQEAAQMYDKAGEQERKDKELHEASIIESYLPKQLSNGELQSVIEETIQEMGLETLEQKDMGRVIGAVNGKVNGQADGARIAAAVKTLIK